MAYVANVGAYATVQQCSYSMAGVDYDNDDNYTMIFSSKPTF